MIEGIKECFFLFGRFVPRSEGGISTVGPAVMGDVNQIQVDKLLLVMNMGWGRDDDPDLFV